MNPLKATQRSNCLSCCPGPSAVPTDPLSCDVDKLLLVLVFVFIFLFYFPFPCLFSYLFLSSHLCPCPRRSHFCNSLVPPQVAFSVHITIGAGTSGVPTCCPWARVVPTLSDTMTSSSATVCHGSDATFTPAIRTRGEVSFANHIWTTTKMACARRSDVWRRTQETFNQQLTVPPASHRRPAFFNTRTTN